jgi:integrase
MAGKLTAAQARDERRPGKYGDGNGLWLIVTPANRRSWCYRYKRAGKTREMSLGNADLITLAKARLAHAEARLLLAKCIDPLDARHAAQQAAAATAAPVGTFAMAVNAYLSAHEASWRNAKHRQQWRNTMKCYAEPVIGNMRVSTITVEDVLRVLTPIWHVKPETASRVRARIEMILDYAAVRKWRTGPNPAIWRGNLKLVLPAKSKVRKVEHHAALDWHEAPAFMAKLRAEECMGAKALEFAVLTATRSNEVRGARWSEIHMDRGVWTIPATRMKGEREHRVPLSTPALAILKEMAEVQDGSGLIFLGRKHGVPIRDMTLTAALRRIDLGHLTAHGFRSTFRDWCADTGKPADIAERALAHVIGNKTRGAYERTDLFDPRRRLMDEWAEYLHRPPAEVVPLNLTGQGS